MILPRENCSTELLTPILHDTAARNLTQKNSVGVHSILIAEEKWRTSEDELRRNYSCTQCKHRDVLEGGVHISTYVSCITSLDLDLPLSAHA